MKFFIFLKKKLLIFFVLLDQNLKIHAATLFLKHLFIGEQSVPVTAAKAMVVATCKLLRSYHLPAGGCPSDAS
jgi:hypothetical protein